jgi:hypothetical protein
VDDDGHARDVKAIMNAEVDGLYARLEGNRKVIDGEGVLGMGGR